VRGPLATPDARPAESQALDRATIDAIARRVIELLGDESSEVRLVDAEEVSRRFALSKGWVYAHAEELGAIRLGSGARPRLRFNPRVVIEQLSSRSVGESSQTRISQAAKPRRGRRRKDHVGQRGDLLPIREPK
jgi:hypothetical protein